MRSRISSTKVFGSIMRFMAPGICLMSNQTAEHFSPHAPVLVELLGEQLAERKGERKTAAQRRLFLVLS